MSTMNYKLLAFIMAATLLGSGCSDEDVHTDPGDTTPNSGAVSLANFSVLFSEVDPTVVDPTTGVFTKTDVEVTAYIGDRSNQQITAPRTIFFKSEYGLIEPSCVTDATGSCSVTWSAIDRPTASGPGSDGFTTIVAYTTGEESFTDNNGNGIFDDLDSGTFNDQEEPYVDFELRSGLAGDGSFGGNDVVIDTVNGNDTTGRNGVHDIADGFFNGGGCTHSTLCSTTVRSPTIWTASANGLFGTTGQLFTVGGNVTGLSGSVTLQNNGGDDVALTADGSFTFATGIANGATYAVTVSSQPAGQTCTVSNGTGTISSSNVTNVAVACSTNTFTIGGNLAGLTGSVTLQNNGGDDLTLNADGAFAFATAINDGATYAVTVSSQPAGQTCTVTNGNGTVATANVTNVTVTCAATTYTVSGTLDGLGTIPAATTLVIRNTTGAAGTQDITFNNGDNFPVAFTFDTTPMLDTDTYAVTIQSNTTGLDCTTTPIAGGSNGDGTGTIAAADVTNIAITCD